MKQTLKAIIEAWLRGVRILKSYGAVYFAQRVVKYLRRRGWRSVLNTGDPNSQYQKWLAQKSLNKSYFAEMASGDCPMISIILPAGPDLEQLQDSVMSIINQESSSWRLYIVNNASANMQTMDFLNNLVKQDERVVFCNQDNNLGLSQDNNLGISEAVNSAIELSQSEYVFIMEQNDILWPQAISAFQKFLCKDASVDLVYADDDKLDKYSNRRTDPYFKPEWSPHLLYSHNYIGNTFVVRKELIKKLGGFRKEYEPAFMYDFLLRLTGLPLKIERIPEIVLSNKADSGTKFEFNYRQKVFETGSLAVRESMEKKGYTVKSLTLNEAGLRNLRINIDVKQKVSIIIPSKNNGQVLKRCIDSIRLKSSFINYEIILINNGSDEEFTVDYLDLISKQDNIKILDYPGEFNYPLVNNLGAAHADGKYLVFLNDDTEVISSDWLEALLEYSQMPDVGAVGALLVFPDGSVQHAGVVIGMRGCASHAFYKCKESSSGYFKLINCVRNVSAVTAACMMIDAGTFARANGFNPEFRVGLNDLDLCLRLLKMGFYNVYTPHARLLHHESLTRGGYVDFGEIELLKSKHQDIFSCGDPFYHPGLSLERNDYSLAV